VSLSADATLRQVRKEADGAREPVRQFISKWKNDARVQGTTPHKETLAALEELGQYYQKRGQRSALDRESAARILQHLQLARDALPPDDQQPGLLNGLLGR
jgi:Photosystem II Pbs27